MPVYSLTPSHKDKTRDSYISDRVPVYVSQSVHPEHRRKPSNHATRSCRPEKEDIYPATRTQVPGRSAARWAVIWSTYYFVSSSPGEYWQPSVGDIGKSVCFLTVSCVLPDCELCAL